MSLTLTNQLRMLSGILIDPKLEKKTKSIEEAVAEPMEPSEESEAPAPDNTAVISATMSAIENVISHLEGQIRQYADNTIVRGVDQGDKRAYERVLALLHKGNLAGAKKTWHGMDTAARDLLSDGSVVRKKANRKAASQLFGFTLLREDMDEGMADMFLKPSDRAKLINPKLFKSAVKLYRQLREEGREIFDALHAASSSFGIDDKVFQIAMEREGIAEAKDVVIEDHFAKGQYVVDKSDRAWEITEEGEGEDGNEEYALKCPKTGKTSTDIAANLRKVDKDRVMEALKMMEDDTKDEDAHDIKDEDKVEEALNLKDAEEKAKRLVKPRATGSIKKFSEKKKKGKKDVDEAVHHYDDNYKSFADDEDKPANVVDGTSNDEQVWDDMERDPESPSQLRRSPGNLGNRESGGYDIDRDVKVPASIKSSLKTEIKKAKDEAQKLDIRDRNSAQFYRDLAKAFDDLLGHLEKGTMYDIKQAQVFAQTLMGPILHKIPDDVWKWLVNGGQRRSLKDFMKDVSDNKKLKTGYDPTKEK